MCRVATDKPPLRVKTQRGKIYDFDSRRKVYSLRQRAAVQEDYTEPFCESGG
jgi:hypothetical protein